MGSSHHDGVNLGELGGELVRVALGETAGDEEAARGRLAIGLELRRLDHRRDRLRLGLLNEGARVDDDNVRVGRLPHHAHTVALQIAEHDLGVDGVLWAAERHLHANNQRGFGGGGGARVAGQKQRGDGEVGVGGA